jgi:hypothetical protein
VIGQRGDGAHGQVMGETREQVGARDTSRAGISCGLRYQAGRAEGGTGGQTGQQRGQGSGAEGKGNRRR